RRYLAVCPSEPGLSSSGTPERPRATVRPVHLKSSPSRGRCLPVALSLEDHPPAVLRAAPALVQLAPFRTHAPLPLVRVVVRQLLAALDVAQRIDEHAIVLFDRLAVGIARVIDEPRVVAADRRVDAGATLQAEQERVMDLHGIVVIATVRLLGIDALALVFD